MANQKVTDILAKINEQETNIDGVGALITDLRAQIANGASAADLDAVLAELEQNRVKLEAALAANVPAPEPQPEG